MSQLIRFEKIVPEGKAMGHLPDGRAVFTIGPLPNELARIGIRKQKRTYAEAALRALVEPSASRSGEAEAHALSCSPWQDVDYRYQCQLKQEMVTESFRQQHIEVPSLKLVPAPEQFHYRNRLDFTVAEFDGTLKLAFYQRGSWQTLLPLLEGCRLGTAKMNQAALEIINQLNHLGIELPKALLTVRQSHVDGQVMAILTTGVEASWSRIRPQVADHWLVARPMAGSGAPGPLTYHSGTDYLHEELHGVLLQYSYNSFFQTNVTAFKQALDHIMASVKPYQHVVELYGGVGAIGLPLAASGKQVKSVEIIPEAVASANATAKKLKIRSYQAETIAAEQMEAAWLEGAEAVIVDPPRAGLHPRVINWIKQSRPQRLIYLSCNPVTQARDIVLLQDIFSLTDLTAFDFYPGTLHVESLAILD